MAKHHSNKELELAWSYLQNTNRNVFLTGNAGTGKTTFLKNLREKSHKRMVVCAPTGVAAINAGGVTLHSFFQLPFGPLLMERVTGKRPSGEMAAFKFNKKKINIIKTLDLLVIDEISMVRADILDAIDDILRKYRNRLLPFGGIQVLMIGDLEQLSPVIKQEEWELLRPYYASVYFFHARVMQEAHMQSIELKHIYRQSDQKFIEILNEIRNNQLTPANLEKLNSRHIPQFEPEDKDEYIMLTTHNATANRINQRKLDKLKTKRHFFKAKVDGIFSEYSYPADFELELKEEAQVMFIKNDSSPEKRYYNGKIGRVTEIDGQNIYVLCEGDKHSILVEPEEWHNMKYELDEKGELQEESVGTFKQFPLRLAWAITIHKSQGLTFEHAIIDAEAAFAHGQTYVALSRCKSLEGMVLSSKISSSAIISDQKVSRFNQEVKSKPPTDEDLQKSIYNFQLALVQELFSYGQIKYRVDRLETLFTNHGRVITGGAKDLAREIRDKTLPQLLGVGKKFQQQVEEITQMGDNLEQNAHFQERIKKAAQWFYQQHEESLEKLLKQDAETDNKEVKKQIKEHWEALQELVFVRQKLLEKAQNGFDIEGLLKIRAEATFDAAKEKPKKGRTNYHSSHPELLSLLRFWRDASSDVRALPQSQIMPYKSLVEISNQLPQSLSELKKIPGIGKVKLREYGDELIDMVLDYVSEKGIKKEIVEEKPKAPKVKSHDLTWQLISGGMSIEEVAKERNLATSTIESHITRCVDKEGFNYSDFVSKEKVLKVLDFFHDHPDASGSDAINELEDDITWFELRLINKMRDSIKDREESEETS